MASVHAWRLKTAEKYSLAVELVGASASLHKAGWT
jgi:hypothetical protein